MDNEPLISVLMTAYNREKYIAEAIQSVLESWYTNLELIIVDDCSDDNTLKIAKSFEERDDRIKVFRNEKNLGDYPNRNKAASYAKGYYLKYLDADDTIYKYSLTYMVMALQQYPEAGMGISSIVSDDVAPYPHLSEPWQTYSSEFLGKSILTCGPSAAIIKAEVFNYVGGFSGKQYISDHELWLKISAKYSIVKLQPALIWWRQHSEQQIAYERKDISIQNIRFQHALQTLSLSKHFFPEKNFLAARQNVKKVYAKYILRITFRKRQFRHGFRLWKMSGLTFVDLLLALK